MTRLQSIHDNSLAAYQAEERKLPKRATAILEWVSEHGPHTDRQIMEAMGFPDMNCVRPRCTELIQASKLMEVGSIICSVTGKRVRRVDIRGQRALFQ